MTKESGSMARLDPPVSTLDQSTARVLTDNGISQAFQIWSGRCAICLDLSHLSKVPSFIRTIIGPVAVPST